MAIKLGKMVAGIGKTVALSVATAGKTVGNVVTGKVDQIGKDFKQMNEKNKEIFESFSGKKVSDKEMAITNAFASSVGNMVATNPGGISLGTLKDQAIMSTLQAVRPAAPPPPAPPAPAAPAGPTLPGDFDPQGYFRNNPDVYAWANADGNPSTEDATSHYLTVGQREGRQYKDRSPVASAASSLINNFTPSPMLPSTPGIKTGQNIQYSNNLTPAQKSQVETQLAKAASTPAEDNPSLWERFKAWKAENVEMFWGLVAGAGALVIGLAWWLISRKGRKRKGSFRRSY